MDNNVFFKSYHNPQLTVNQQNQGEGISMITDVFRDRMMAVTYLGFLWQAPTYRQQEAQQQALSHKRPTAAIRVPNHQPKNGKLCHLVNLGEGKTIVTRRSVEHCTPHADGAWLNELGWSQ